MKKDNVNIPENCSNKEYKKWFWSELNVKCLKCAEQCKQSAKVKVIRCNNYKEIEENNE